MSEIQGFRLSPSQAHLWRRLAEEGPTAFVARCRVEIAGAFDASTDRPALARALAVVGERWEILRTGFRTPPGMSAPLQEVSPAVALALGEGSAPVPPIDLAAPPLLRAALATGADGVAVLDLALPALLADDAGLDLLVRALAGAYGEQRGETPEPSDDEPLQYADLADWLCDLVESPETQAGRDYWGRQEIAPLDPAELPIALLPRGEFAPARREIALPAGLPAQLGTERLATAWSILLARLAARPDVALSVAFSGRKFAELEGALGLFSPRIPVPFELPGELSFAEAEARVALALAERLGFEEVFAEELLPGGIAPELPFSFVRRAAPTSIEAGGATFRVRDREVIGDRFLFELRVDGAGLELGYDANRVGEAEAERLTERFLALLEDALARPAAPIGELSILGAAERARLIHEGNDTARGLGPLCTLNALFAAQAARTPARLALESETGERTYAQLAAESGVLAGALAARGVGRGSIVALALDRSPEMVIALLAVLQTGAAYLPLETSLPAERLAWMLADARPALLLLGGGTPEDFGGSVPAIDLRSFDFAAARTVGTAEIGPDDLAYVIYTSGSTGQPKGVAVSHGAIVNRLLWMQSEFPLGEGDAVVQKTPYSFDASIWEIFVPLLSGARLWLARPGAHGDVAYLAQLVTERGITVLQLVPSLLGPFLATEESALCRGKLRRLFCGGEALSADLAAHALERLGIAPVNLYGPTEAAIDAAFFTATGAERGPQVPIGAPIANDRIFLLDGRGNLAPSLGRGEMALGGAGLARGYLGRPDLTAERFVPDPFGDLPGERLYRTGDIGRWNPAGMLEYLGRIDAQVKIRGVRVELGEIEAALARLAGVAEAAAALRVDRPGDPRLAAYLVASPGATIDVPALSARLAATLPDVMVPADWVVLPALPRLPSGKIDRRGLPAIDAGRSGRVSRGGEYVAPRTPTEQLVAERLAALLGVPQIGVLDNIFDLGFHSLHATQLGSRLRRTFGVDIPLRSLFELPTVAQLAARIDAGLRDDPRLEAPPLVRGVRLEAGEPLSFAQSRLWFVDLMQPGSPFYNIPVALSLSGRLVHSAFTRAIGEIVRRHDSLRTTFAEVDAEPVQRVAAPSDRFALSEIDLTALPEAQKRREAARLVRAEALAPFDLARGPLLRSALLRIERSEHVALFTFHHIVSDGWSTGIVTTELAALYAAFVAGRPSPLPEPELQYVDYARWQREWLGGEAFTVLTDFWRGELGDAPERLDLPSDRPRPGVLSNRGGVRMRRLSPAFAAEIEGLARSESATLFMVALGAGAALLGGLAGVDDLVIGTDVAGRSRAETEGIVGFFINQLPLRCRLGGDPSFRDLVARVRETTLAAYAHQDLPFDKLVEAVSPERSRAFSPIFQVKVNLHNLPAPPLELPELSIASFAATRESAQFDWALNLTPANGGFDAWIEYSADLFDGTTVERMLARYEALLRSVLVRPAVRLGEISLLSAAERHQLLQEWNAPGARFAAEQLLHRRFEAQAARRPGALAVTFDLDPITYGDLDARANRLARRLVALGVAPGDRVGLCLERSLELIVGLLGIAKTGAAYLPLDPSYPGERLAFMLGDSGARALVTAESHLELLAGLQASEEVKILCLDRDAAAIAAESSAPLSRLPDLPASTAYVIYTSGSTGQPKGVEVSHSRVARLFAATDAWFGFGERDVWTMFHSFAFDFSVWEIWGALLYGGRLVVVPYKTSRSPAAFLELVRAAGVTVLNQTPSAFRQLLAEAMATGALDALAKLRFVIFGGEALEIASLAPWFDHFTGGFKDAPLLINMYGITETTVHVTYRPVRRADLARPGSAIGVPIPDLQVHLVDAQGNLVPVGVAGEMLIGGEGVAQGYLGRPELTAERFRPDPWHGTPGSRLYRSGDLARRCANGDLEYLGRIDFQVKIRGFRIELGEIETALAGQPEVREAAVVAGSSRDGETRLIAYVVSEPRAAAGAADATVARIRRALEARLPAYMVPATFVWLERLPLSRNGKVDRKALPEPDETRLEPAEGYVEPRTATEEILAGLFAEVLGLQRVGTSEDFFALGGHSLSATKVISRARRVLGVELQVHQLFEAPTVTALAREVERSLGSGIPAAPPFERIPRSDEGGARLPMSFAQARLWFLEQMRPDTAMFNIPDAVRMRGALDIAALESALSSIVARHESLRTVFPAVRGEPVPTILPPSRPALPRLDLSALRAGAGDLAGAQRREVLRLLAMEADRPLDLARGPLLRLLLLPLAERDHVMAFISHHIASDAWSSGVFVNELGSFYRAALRGEEAQLRPLPFQYADFAAWQRRYLTGETLEQELSWWRARLAGAPPVLDLPADRKRPARASDRGLTRSVLLPTAVADGLRALARREGATPFMALFAAWLVVLKHLAGRDDLVVGTDVANRNREETEGILGFFINQLALRVDLSGDPTFAELVGRVRTVALGAYAHQDVPFDALVDTLSLDRTLAHAPLFQVKLFLENASRSAEPVSGLRIEALEVEIRVAKLDLVLAFWERPEGFVGWVNFSTDLFDTPRVERWMRQLGTVAGRAGHEPDAPLSRILSALSTMEKEEQAMDKRGLKERSFKSFKAVQPKAVSIGEAEVVRRGYLAPDQKLPLVLSPAVPDADLAEWAAGNVAEIQADLLAHGAILFRGFAIDTPEALEGFASTLCAELFNENGEHPRESVTGKVYTPVFYPQDQQLLWHNENSFNWRWPRKIWFACAVPAAEGGETPLVDSRRVYEEIPEEIRAAFEEKGVLYQRTYSEGLGLPWQTVFRTDDVAEVEREAAASKVELSWRSGDRLRTRGKRPAVIAHPVTGEKTWFNQGQHWHVACLDPETSESMRALFADDELPRHLFFGDGSPIPDEWMAVILDVYARLEVSFPWQKGDVVLLDNVLVAHGRNPFRAPRKILVAMGEMTSYDDVGGGGAA